MKLRFFVQYGLRGIRRGGQRGFVAMLSVVFGVMSLVTMVTLSQSISTVLLIDPRLDLGGDALLWRDDFFLSPADIDEIARYQKAGAIDAYAPVELAGSLVLKTPDSGQVTFLRGGVGFDPGTYPLMGTITLGTPAGASPEEVLQSTGDVIITRDIALGRHLQVGDKILVTNRLGGRPRDLRVAGIAVETPNYKGGHLYYNMDTSRMATGHDHPYNGIYVLWGHDSDAVISELKAAGWKLRLPYDDNGRNQEIQDTFGFMLRGAGILGLLVGGIGIANTMQVLLAHRKEEVAVLKTLGYARHQMIALFLIETAMMGVIGSLLGVVLAIGLSRILVNMVERIVTLFMPWHFDPWVGLGGLAVGVVTTMLFALNAILQASDVRPAVLFRQLPPPRRRWLRTLGVYALLSLPFGAVTSLIQGSVLKGVGVLLIALAGLLGFSALLGGSMWVVLRLLPTFQFHLLRMARNAMRRRALSMLSAMIALFIGVFSLGLAVTVVSSAVDELARQSFSLEGINLVVLADPTEEARVRDALVERGVENVNVRFEAPLNSVVVDGVENGNQDLEVLQGRHTLWDVEITGSPWGTVSGGAYVPAASTVPLGTEIEVTGTQGERQSLTVVGIYEATAWEDGLLNQAVGVLVDAETFLTLSGEDYYFIVAGEADVDRLTSIRDEVGRVLPQTMVLTSIDVDNLFSGTLKNLFFFAVAMSGLALVAGGVLIANAVSLAMIERRNEIGILKAVGYSQGNVMLTVLLEHSLIALVAGGVGVFALELFIVLLQLVQETAGEMLHINALTGLFIVAIAVGLTLLTVVITAWRPTRVRPLVILNQNT